MRTHGSTYRHRSTGRSTKPSRQRLGGRTCFFTSATNASFCGMGLATRLRDVDMGTCGTSWCVCYISILGMLCQS